MKKMKFFASSMLCIAVVMSSCSNDVETPIDQKDRTTRSEAAKLLTITYNGVTYQNVPTTYDENGDFVFLDSTFAPIYEKELANEENLSINVKSADEIEFFHSLKSNLEANGYDYDESEKEMTQGKANISTLAVGYEALARVELFENKNFGKLRLTYELTSQTISVAERRLHYQNFNDKCSSLKIYNNIPNDSTKTIQLGAYEYICSKVDAVFIGYEDKDYSKSSVTYYATPATNAQITELAGFNDKMSSFKFFFAQNGHY